MLHGRTRRTKEAPAGDRSARKRFRRRLHARLTLAVLRNEKRSSRPRQLGFDPIRRRTIAVAAQYAGTRDFEPREERMPTDNPAAAIVAAEAPPRQTPSSYPAVFAARMAGRVKRPLGEVFGLRNFGVNLTRLDAGAQSALRHAHRVQDEFVYVLEGEVTLATDAGEQLLRAGMCAGFPAGGTNAHHLINRGSQPAVYLEVGDRSAGDCVIYPDDDLQARRGEDGSWRYLHKDGRPYGPYDY